MQRIISFVTRAPPKNQPKHDDDFVDRLHHRYTTSMLVVFALVILTQQHIGSPMICWAPVHFKPGHVKYTNSYCWISNTYVLPFEDRIPKEHEHEKRNTILYYQWIPILLLLQAVFFKLPNVIWNGLKSRSGVNVADILTTARNLQRADKVTKRDQMMTLMTNQLDRFLGTIKAKKRKNLSSVDPCNGSCSLDSQKAVSRILARVRIGFGRRFGNYLILLYVFVKTLYLGNLAAQLIILNHLTGANFTWFGQETMRNLGMLPPANSQVNRTIFPRVTMCDMVQRRLGNNHRYTLQCVLPLNMYAEKMYSVFWLWGVLLMVLTVYNLLTWVATMCIGRQAYIMRHLGLTGETFSGEEQKQRVHEFIHTYLHQDGALIMRLIGHNLNTFMVSEVLAGLWRWWSPQAQRRLLHLKLESRPHNESPRHHGHSVKPSIPPKPATLRRNIPVNHSDPDFIEPV